MKRKRRSQARPRPREQTQHDAPLRDMIPPPIERVSTPLAVALLAVLSVIPYVRTWRFGFVHLDDYQFMVRGGWFFRSWENLPRAFSHDVWEFFGEESSLYRPLLLIPRFFEVRIFDGSPGAFHILNTALHAASVVAFYVLLRALTRSPRAALIWAALLAAHPVNVPVVAWIEGRNNSMLALLVLVAITLALRALETGRRGLVVASAATFFAALLTKENAVFTPLLVAGAHLLQAREATASRPSASVVRWMLGAWTLALVVWGALRSHAIPTTPELAWPHIAESLSRNYPGPLLYWGKVFFPVNLAPLPILRDSSLVPGALAAALYGALWARSAPFERRVLAFGAGWFLLLISPSLVVDRLTSPVGAIFREDRLYQASMGPLLALAWVSRGLIERHFNAARAVALATLLAALVEGQSLMGRYADGLSFFTAAVAGSPHSAVASTHLGDMQVERGDWAGARTSYERALALNPLCPMLNNNYALLLMHDGELERADPHFQREIEINPSFKRVHYNRGLLRSRMGDLLGATESFEAFLALGAHDRELVLMSRLALINGYRRLGRFDRAEQVAGDLRAMGATLVSGGGP